VGAPESGIGLDGPSHRQPKGLKLSLGDLCGKHAHIRGPHSIFNSRWHINRPSPEILHNEEFDLAGDLLNSHPESGTNLNGLSIGNNQCLLARLNFQTILNRLSYTLLDRSHFVTPKAGISHPGAPGLH
jgi:hypothetical protein